METNISASANSSLVSRKTSSEVELMETHDSIGSTRLLDGRKTSSEVELMETHGYASKIVYVTVARLLLKSN